MKNCDESGELVRYETTAEYKKTKNSLWLYLQLCIFRENQEIFNVFSCPECVLMKPVESLSIDQSREEMEKLQCFHSKAAQKIVPDYEAYWTIPQLGETTTSASVFCNDEIGTQTKKVYTSTLCNQFSF